MTNPLDLINKPRLIELTESLVGIYSVTGEEHELADWMYAHFKSIGLSGVQRLPVEESGDSIVGWIDGPGDKPAMMLNFHLDTFAAFDGWQTEPFKPHLEDGKLHGVGAHDMKGGGACVLMAVEALLQSGVELGGRLIVSTTTDEENWSRGAHALIQTGLLENCAYCLVPEPTQHGQLTIGQRGRHVFQLTFHGKTIHAAYRVGGINAVVDASRVAAVIAGLDWKDLGYNADFDMTGSICVTGLHGGSTIILVPELAQLYIDRHILPGQTVEEAAEQIRAAVAQANIESRYDLTWDERPVPAPTSFVVPSDSKLVQTVTKNMATELGQEIKHVLGRSVADTNHFAVHGGVPTLIYGPQGGNTCEANEYVLIDSMPGVARVYTQSVLDLLG